MLVYVSLLNVCRGNVADPRRKDDVFSTSDDVKQEEFHVVFRGSVLLWKLLERAEIYKKGVHSVCINREEYPY